MSDQEQVPGVAVRYTSLEDGPYLAKWLMEPGVLNAFPMANQAEVDDAVKHWIGFSKFRSSLTAVVDEKPCGLATLSLMPYEKISHQCLVSIIVSGDMRGKGVGTLLLNNLIHLAKDYFHIEVLYLEMYEGNPARSLYHRFGFKEIGNQKHFMKENGQYIGKVIMERVI